MAVQRYLVVATGRVTSDSRAEVYEMSKKVRDAMLQVGLDDIVVEVVDLFEGEIRPCQ